MKNNRPVLWLELKFRFLDNPLNDLPSYIGKNKEWIEQEKKDLEWQMEKWSQENLIGGNTDIDSYDFFEEDIIRIHKNYESVFFNSLLIVAYSQFEITLKNICKETELFVLRKIKLNDLSGTDYIARSKIYIEKVLEIDMFDLEDKWKKIKDYQKIRNKIVHNDGKIEKSEMDTFRNIVKQYAHLELVEHGAIDRYFIRIQDSDYVLEFCKVISEYIEEVKTRIIKKLKAMP